MTVEPTNDLVQFAFGPAVIAFVLCVAMSMIASLSFDPHFIWKDEPYEEKDAARESVPRSQA